MKLRVLICMENSGTFRRALQDQGHYVVSVDWLPSTDNADELEPHGGHLMYTEVFEVLEKFPLGFFDFAIFHPTCTLHTVAAAWAFKDPDFERYPGVGYHQRVSPGTLVGEARRTARLAAEADSSTGCRGGAGTHKAPPHQEDHREPQGHHPDADILRADHPSPPALRAWG